MKAKKYVWGLLLVFLLTAAGTAVFVNRPEKRKEENILRAFKGVMPALPEEKARETENRILDGSLSQAPPYYTPPKLKVLLKSNPWVVGWLKIDDTNIDYPVVQNREDNEWFLHRDINGEESYPGSIYLDSWHEMEDKGFHVVYGHRMRDGTMFKDISRFTDMDYLNNHRRIRIWTRKRKIRLEPVYCYVGAADGSYRILFDSGKEMETFLYEKTGYSVPSDNVFVFITCSYEQRDGRCYLICREVNG